MVEKLIVKNFVGIKELEIEIKRINILIGPQASGKSVCAKLLFYFKNFVWQILATVDNEQTKRNLDANYSKTFEEYFPSDSWGNHNFFIRYEIADAFIEISRKQDSKRKIVLDYSDLFKKELAELRTFAKELSEKSLSRSTRDPLSIDFDRIVFRAFLRDALIDSLNKSLGQQAVSIQSFIPAGRAFYANIQSNIFTLLRSENKLDPFFTEFGSFYESLIGRSYTSNDVLDEKKEIKDIQEKINLLVESALCGRYIREKGKDFLEIPDGRRINVANSSSGQQELLPLTIVLAALPFLTSSPSGRTFYIEEPEAHLFPNAQRSVVELIATVFNYRKEKLQFFITTHSPYVLTAVNNLLQAGLLYQKADQDVSRRIEKVIPEYKALNTSDLSAYVLADGKCNSIICPDTGLIDATIIDAVSDDLAVEFDKLLALT